MKRVKKVLCATVLIVAFFISSSVAIVSSAYYRELDPNTVIRTPYLNNRVTSYYSHLINHFGYNRQDTCTYVALGMLLTYYDSFIHDNFVADSHIVKSTDEYGYPLKYGSPGALNEENIYQRYMREGKTYLQLINDFSSSSLQLYLINIALNESLDIYSSNARTGGEGSFAINAYEMVDILESYLFASYGDRENLFLRNQITVRTLFASEGVSESTIYQTMKAKILEGIPVIYLGFKNTRAAIDNEKLSGDVGHAMIAYDYNSTNDDIYVHLGYSMMHNRDMSIDDSGYTNAGGIVWLEINNSLTHTHSTNYYHSGTYYCGDQFYQTFLE